MAPARMSVPLGRTWGNAKTQVIEIIKGGEVIRRDRLRKFIKWSVEAYNVACDPPACNYSRSVDVVEKDDVNSFSRAHLLRLSIDVKWIVADLLVKLPKRRAEVLHGWIENTSEYAEAMLTYRQREYLKRDRRTLANRLREGLGR